jgi:hypothetical protein
MTCDNGFRSPQCHSSLGQQLTRSELQYKNGWEEERRGEEKAAKYKVTFLDALKRLDMARKCMC